MSRSALIKPYLVGGILFGLFLGALSLGSYFWTAGYRKPAKEEKPPEVLRDLKGIVSGENGSLTVILPDGRSERSQRFSMDADGLSVRLSDGKDHRLQGDKK